MKKTKRTTGRELTFGGLLVGFVWLAVAFVVARWIHPIGVVLVLVPLVAFFGEAAGDRSEAAGDRIK